MAGAEGVGDTGPAGSYLAWWTLEVAGDAP